MNRRELVLALAEQTDTDRKTADAWLVAFVDVVTQTVSTGEPVAILGLREIRGVDRPARMGRNPATGEAIKMRGCASGSRATTPASSTGRRPRGEASRSLGNTRTSAGSRSCSLIDAGRLLTAEVDGVPRLEAVVSAALHLAYAAVEHDDNVGLLVFADTIQRYVAPARGRRALRAVLEGLAAAEGRLVESDYPAAFRIWRAQQEAGADGAFHRRRSTGPRATRWCARPPPSGPATCRWR